MTLIERASASFALSPVPQRAGVLLPGGQHLQPFSAAGRPGQPRGVWEQRADGPGAGAGALQGGHVDVQGVRQEPIHVRRRRYRPDVSSPMGRTSHSDVTSCWAAGQSDGQFFLRCLQIMSHVPPDVSCVWTRSIFLFNQPFDLNLIQVREFVHSLPRALAGYLCGAFFVFISIQF